MHLKPIVYILFVFLQIFSFEVHANIATATTVQIQSHKSDEFPLFTNYKKALKKSLEINGVPEQIRKGKRYLLKIAHNNGQGLSGYLSYQTDLVEKIIDEHKSQILYELPDNQRKEAKKILNERSKVLESESRTNENEFRNKLEDLRQKTAKSVLGRWNVKGYPAVVGPHTIRAWVELIKEWGGEPWVGDQSGIITPRTYENMKKSGVLDAIKECGAKLWIFDKGLVDFNSNEEKYITELNGQKLSSFKVITSKYLESYNNEARLAEAFTNDFFDGIFFASFPKSHTLTRITNTIKNFVGIMHTKERRHMHHLGKKIYPGFMTFSHNKMSDYMISEMSFALKELLGKKIIGYIGENIGTLSNGGPDLGSPVTFNKEHWSVTFSRDLVAHETATLYSTFTASRNFLKGKLLKKITFNKYFKKRDPIDYRILKHYLEIAEKNGVIQKEFKWQIRGSKKFEKSISDLVNKGNGKGKLKIIFK